MKTNIVYSSELGKLYCCDCLEYLRSLPDNHVDLILTDPPYGVNRQQRGKWGSANLAQMNNYGDYSWDTGKLPEVYFCEMLRVSKNQIIFGGNYYIEFLHNSNCWIVWNKVNGENHFADCELAWTSFDTAVRIFTWKWHGMLQQDMKNKEKRVHPAQKPTPLFYMILQKYTSEGDVILDPFIGSGTTAIACEMLNRKWIGVDKSSEYCDIAMERIKEYKQQLRFET